MDGEKAQEFEALSIVHITKTRYMFSPSSLYALKNSDVLDEAGVPYTAAIVDNGAYMSSE